MRTRVAILQQDPIEPAGTIEDALGVAGVDFFLVETWREPMPSDDSFTHAIILPGPMSVNDESKYLFLEAEENAIKKMILSKRPVLGVCFGGQMIAKAAGAAVIPMKCPEIGWKELRFEKNGLRNAILKNFETTPVFLWHSEAFEIPPTASNIASTEQNRNQAFIIGSAYAIQWHIEVNEQIIKDWLLAFKPSVNEDVILEETKRFLPLYKTACERAIKAFVSL